MRESRHGDFIVLLAAMDTTLFSPSSPQVAYVEPIKIDELPVSICAFLTLAALFEINIKSSVPR